MSYQPTGAKEPALGTIKIEGPTSVSVDDSVVRMDLRITEYNFKSLSPEQVKTLVAEVQARPQNERVIDLARVLAYVDTSPLQVRERRRHQGRPAEGVLGARARDSREPRRRTGLEPVEGLDLRYALNTNWDLLEHTPSKTLYLRYNQSWLQADGGDRAVVAGTGKLPASFSKLPADDNWKDVKAAVPGKKLSGKAVPKVFVSMEPAELIVLDGDASYLKVRGRADAAVGATTPRADLFRMGLNGDFYFLVAGRWFKAASLDGPWTFATPTLPDDFKQDSGRASAIARARLGARARGRRPKRCCSRRFREPRASTRKS